MDDLSEVGDEVRNIVASLNADSRDEQSNEDADNSHGLFGPSTSSNAQSFTDGNEQTTPSSTFTSIDSPAVNPQLSSPSSSRRPITSPPLSAAPLATLSRSSTSTPRRTAHFMEEHSIIVTETPAEKELDDLTNPENALASNDAYSTPSALSRLLGAETTLTPVQSGTPSYEQGNVNLERSYSTLPSHLYTRGLLGGRHSDITIIAFGHRYNLHRIILDRAPFFANALTEPWLESTAKEAELHPEDTDKNITQTSFELALKTLYGVDISEEGETEAVGLFATGCWLEMQELVEASINSILRQICPENLAPLIHTMTEHYYGRSGERILASAKAMLCRDGWEMPLKNWDGIPGETVREIVGSDGFFVKGEWERWVLAKRLLDRRLKQRAIESGLVDAYSRTRVKVPETIGLMSIRFDASYRKNAMMQASHNPTNQNEKWIALYTHSDIEPIVVLLDEGIHYVHLEFEQLQYIRQARDIFSLPVLADSVVTTALWLQLELRQKVINAREGDLELGISQPAEPPRQVESPQQTLPVSENSKGKGKLSEAIGVQESREEDELDSDTWEPIGRPRKFWIPSTDCNIVMGANAEPVYTTNASSSLLRHVNRMSATIDPPDVQWATDFASSPSTNIEGINRPTTPAGRSDGSEQPKPIAYTTFPPFRFAAEFPNPRLLKEKKRVYSRTVFYAGSLWNIYIQKVRSQKNPQLGVYLHRAKERETDEILSSTGVTSSTVGSVDERIGLLEREMILRSEQRSRIRGGRDPGRRTLDTLRTTRNSISSSDTTTLIPDHEATSTRSTFTPRSSGYPVRRGRDLESYMAFDSDTDEDEDTLLHWSESDGYLSAPPKLPPLRVTPISAPVSKRALPTLPPYVDPRPTIKTYFKIYSPSKGGRLLSVYESAPDKFDFSQSWGWRSSTLMLDEVFLQHEPEITVTDQAEEAVAAAGGSGTGDAADNDLKALREKERKKRDSILRFMVVIGNL